MPIRSAACLAFALVLAPAARAEEAVFDFYMTGIRIGEVTLETEQTDGSYTAASRITTAGLIGVLADFWYNGAAEGELRDDGTVVPRRFVAKSKSPRAIRDTDIAWEGGTPVSVSVEPPRGSAPEPSAQAGTLDPVSAGFAVLRAREPDRLCDTSVEVFDGSRRSRLKLGAVERRDGALRLRRHLRAARGRGAQPVEPARVPLRAHLPRGRRPGSPGWSASRPAPSSARRCSSGGAEPPPPWPPLPIEPALAPLAAALAAQGRAVLQAPPGAGKTTRVPLHLLDAGVPGRILMLEPRRVAARAAAERLAGSLGEAPGRAVGYRIRGEAVPGSRIEVVTEGILTRMIQSDPELAGRRLRDLRRVPRARARRRPRPGAGARDPRRPAPGPAAPRHVGHARRRPGRGADGRRAGDHRRGPRLAGRDPLARPAVDAGAGPAAGGRGGGARPARARRDRGRGARLPAGPGRDRPHRRAPRAAPAAGGGAAAAARRAALRRAARRARAARRPPQAGARDRHRRDLADHPRRARGRRRRPRPARPLRPRLRHDPARHRARHPRRGRAAPRPRRPGGARLVLPALDPRRGGRAGEPPAARDRQRRPDRPRARARALGRRLARGHGVPDAAAGAGLRRGARAARRARRARRRGPRHRAWPGAGRAAAAPAPRPHARSAPGRPPPSSPRSSRRATRWRGRAAARPPISGCASPRCAIRPRPRPRPRCAPTAPRSPRSAPRRSGCAPSPAPPARTCAPGRRCRSPIPTASPSAARDRRRATCSPAAAARSCPRPIRSRRRRSWSPPISTATRARR